MLSSELAEFQSSAVPVVSGEGGSFFLTDHSFSTCPSLKVSIKIPRQNLKILPARAAVNKIVYSQDMILAAQFGSADGGHIPKRLNVELNVAQGFSSNF